MSVSQKWAPTPEQVAIVDAVGGPQSGPSTMVEAGAGCAKTSTLELAGQRIKVPALALAFNKRIAQEMAKRLPGNFSVKTMNGLGHGAWARAITVQTIKLDERKLGRLITAVGRDWNRSLDSDEWDNIRKLVSEAQHQGLVPSGDPYEDTTLIPDDVSGWGTLASNIGLLQDEFEPIWELAREVLKWNISEARSGTISFDDQVYCSTMLGGRFPQFPQLFLDEDQDLNPLNIRMVGQCVRPGGRLLAVGDKQQSIYAFRGAVGQAAEALRGFAPSWTDLPLMTTFRCPKLVVERQREHVPMFRAFGTNPTGVVAALPRAVPAGLEESEGSGEGWTWADLQALLPNVGSPLAILCRNNAPLMKMAFRLLRRQIGCYMLGRDIGKGLIALSRKITSDDTLPASQVRGAIEQWLSRETSKAMGANRPELVGSLNDRAECLLAVMDGAECRDAGDLRASLGKLFARENGLVTLSSIHRAKGLEWDAVLHLDPWRVPSRQARQAGGRALEQELNLKYVCETRTKHTLILASLEDFQ